MLISGLFHEYIHRRARRKLNLVRYGERCFSSFELISSLQLWIRHIFLLQSSIFLTQYVVSRPTFIPMAISFQYRKSDLFPLSLSSTDHLIKHSILRASTANDCFTKCFTTQNCPLQGIVHKVYSTNGYAFSPFRFYVSYRILLAEIAMYLCLMFGYSVKPM